MKITLRLLDVSDVPMFEEKMMVNEDAVVSSKVTLMLIHFTFHKLYNIFARQQ